MSCARFDLTPNGTAYHQETLKNLKQASANTRRLVCTMLDTKGPEIEVINREGPLSFASGQTVIVTGDASRKTSSDCIVISLETVHQLVDPGRQIFVGEYLCTGAEASSAYLTVKSVEGTNVVCTVSHACKLDGPLLTVHISNLRNPNPILSTSDEDAIRTFAAANQVDYISVSFTRNVEDIRTVRALLQQSDLAHAGVIAKIESLEGLLNYKEIIAEADGVIVSRGNLGIDLAPEKVFLAQKLMLHEANMLGKPAIVTRVVDTMANAPRPTRAEATDVANLVLVRVPHPLLSRVTPCCSGPEIPFLAHRMAPIASCWALRLTGASTPWTVPGRLLPLPGMPRSSSTRTSSTSRSSSSMEDTTARGWQVRLQLETGLHSKEEIASPCSDLDPPPFAEVPMDRDEALASAAVRGANKIDASVILCFTQSGRTPRLVAKYRSPIPILTMVVPKLSQEGIKWRWSGETQARQCLLVRGCIPVLIDPARPSHIEGVMMANAVTKAIQMGFCKNGDRMVVIQCPRRGSDSSWRESGIVKNIVVGAHASDDLLKIGSFNDLMGINDAEDDEY